MQTMTFDNPQLDMIVGDARDYLPSTVRHVTTSSSPSPQTLDQRRGQPLHARVGGQGGLADDGLYVQWLQVYSISDEAFSRTLNTLRSVFPWVTVWRSTAATLDGRKRQAARVDLEKPSMKIPGCR